MWKSLLVCKTIIRSSSSDVDELVNKVFAGVVIMSTNMYHFGPKLLSSVSSFPARDEKWLSPIHSFIILRVQAVHHPLLLIKPSTCFTLTRSASHESFLIPSSGMNEFPLWIYCESISAPPVQRQNNPYVVFIQPKPWYNFHFVRVIYYFVSSSQHINSVSNCE